MSSLVDDIDDDLLDSSPSCEIAETSKISVDQEDDDLLLLASSPPPNNSKELAGTKESNGKTAIRIETPEVVDLEEEEDEEVEDVEIMDEELEGDESSESEESDSEVDDDTDNDLDEKINIFYSHGSFFLWNAEDAQMIREECRIVGKLAGCLARAPRQNVQLGLPLQLMPEEAKMLIDIDAAVLVKEKPASKQLTETRKAAFENIRQQNFRIQQQLFKKQRQQDVSQRMDTIIAGKKAKKRKLKEGKGGTSSPKESKSTLPNSSKDKGKCRHETKYSDDVEEVIISDEGASFDDKSDGVQLVESSGNKQESPSPLKESKGSEEVIISDDGVDREDKSDGVQLIESSGNQPENPSPLKEVKDREELVISDDGVDRENKLEGLQLVESSGNKPENPSPLKEAKGSEEVIISDDGVDREDKSDGVQLVESSGNKPENPSPLEEPKESEEVVISDEGASFEEDKSVLLMESSYSKPESSSPLKVAKVDDVVRKKAKEKDLDELTVDDIVTKETSVCHAFVQIFTENPWKQNIEVHRGWKYPSGERETLRYLVFKDLWGKGFFLTSGAKFGGDFLVYPGDPARYHSHYIAVCRSQFDEIPCLDIVSLGRLASNVRKTALLCALDRNKKVTYTSLTWTGIR